MVRIEFAKKTSNSGSRIVIRSEIIKAEFELMQNI